MYEAGLFDEEVHAVIRRGFEEWRTRLGDKIRRALAARPPRMPVDADELADMLNVVVEGAYVMGKSLGEPMLARYLRHYRAYLELVFGLEPRAPAAA